MHNALQQKSARIRSIDRSVYNIHTNATQCITIVIHKLTNDRTYTVPVPYGMMTTTSSDSLGPGDPRAAGRDPPGSQVIRYRYVRRRRRAV